MKLLPHRIWFSKRPASHGGRVLLSDVLIFIALVALLISRATAAVHPVPLDPKTSMRQVSRVPRGQVEGQGCPLRDCDGLPELPRSPGQQRHHPRKAHHHDSAVALPHLPRRQRCARHQRDSSSAGGSRLPQVPRSAYLRQQESAAEGDLRRQERQPLPHLPHSRD